jgi:hypothetical protein
MVEEKYNPFKFDHIVPLFPLERPLDSIFYDITDMFDSNREISINPILNFFQNY